VSHHIKHTHQERLGTAWCGARLDPFDWCFKDLDHAAYNEQQNQLVKSCPRCVAEAVKALTSRQAGG
jgi:hypothetical protein